MTGSKVDMVLDSGCAVVSCREEARRVCEFPHEYCTAKRGTR